MCRKGIKNERLLFVSLIVFGCVLYIYYMYNEYCAVRYWEHLKTQWLKSLSYFSDKCKGIWGQDTKSIPAISSTSTSFAPYTTKETQDSNKQFLDRDLSDLTKVYDLIKIFRIFWVLNIFEVLNLVFRRIRARLLWWQNILIQTVD